MKDVWRSVKTRTGALYVMICGMLVMPVWCADSLDSPDTVSSWDFCGNLLIVSGFT